MLPQTYSLGRGKIFPLSEASGLVWLSLFVSIGDIINKFRTSTLGLSPLTLRSGPGMIDHYKVPWTYCMSPSLVPKPDDWKNHIGMNQKIYKSWEWRLRKKALSRRSGVLFPWFSSELPASAWIVDFLWSRRATHIHWVRCQMFSMTEAISTDFGRFGSVVIDDPAAMSRM